MSGGRCQSSAWPNKRQAQQAGYSLNSHTPSPHSTVITDHTKRHIKVIKWHNNFGAYMDGRMGGSYAPADCLIDSLARF